MKRSIQRNTVLSWVVIAILLAVIGFKLRTHRAEPIIVGAERMALVQAALAGKQVGLIVNQSSLVGDKHLIDVLQEDGIEVVKLFAVEHGVRGKADAGAVVDDSVDARTGLPIVSIYGKNKTPKPQDVADLDILVYDLQDVGVRFYTYLSSLHYIMQSCADNGVPLLVLDRPNPNGAYIDGPILQPAFQSFVGMHPIPVLHGMTLGELAQMINGEGWLDGGKTCNVTVVPVKNYTKADEYNLPVKPSPNLPNAQSIRLYPSLALFEATNISVGRGTEFPFQVLGGTHPDYGDFTFTPKPTPGAAMNPKHNGQKLYGQDLRGADISGLNIDIFIKWYGRAQALDQNILSQDNWLNKLIGTDSFGAQIKAGRSAQDIRDSWQQDLSTFKTRRKPYLLYAD